MPDLVTWLLEQITEDGRIATKAAAASNQNCYINEPAGPAWEANGAEPIAGARTTHRGFDENVPLWGCDTCHCSGYFLADEVALHIAEHDPARVLAECDAKRRIVDLLVEQGRLVTCEQCDEPYPMHSDDCGGYPGDSIRTVELLALPYADRPGYREEWRP